ncbi:MAG TPA: ATP-dependent Clp protease adaptor ClpS [Nitrospiria bacterium]|nr:ATP-dependent Clp protease adaptor ClpS [Nitrospiria bacterium]
MSASRTAEAPTRQEQPALGDSVGDRFRVILYNDDVHAFDDVVRQVQRATGVSTEEAFAITLQAHEAGRAVCYVGSSDACDKVAGILREIALHVEIDHAG